MDYRKLYDCMQNDYFTLSFITVLLEEVGGTRGTLSWTVTLGITIFLWRSGTCTKQPSRRLGVVHLVGDDFWAM